MMVVQRWMRRSLSAAVGRWLYQSCKQQQLRFKMWKVIQRWGSIAIASSFEAWRAEYQLIKVVQYVVIKWYKVRTSQGFGRLARVPAQSAPAICRCRKNSSALEDQRQKSVLGSLEGCYWRLKTPRCHWLEAYSMPRNISSPAAKSNLTC